MSRMLFIGWACSKGVEITKTRVVWEVLLTAISTRRTKGKGNERVGCLMTVNLLVTSWHYSQQFGLSGQKQLLTWFEHSPQSGSRIRQTPTVSRSKRSRIKPLSLYICTCSVSLILIQAKKLPWANSRQILTSTFSHCGSTPAVVGYLCHPWTLKAGKANPEARG